MAKSDSIIKLQGTIAGLTFVRSRTYGDHVRAKRGTYKSARVNEALQQESKTLLRANVPAKIFKDAIDPYRGELTGGMLWQRLVSMFRKQLKENGACDFAKMERFEIHADYPFERFLYVQPAIKFEKKKSMLRVDLKYDSHPRFAKAKSVSGYRLTVIGIFPDLKKKNARTVAVTSKVIALTGAIAPLETRLDVPSRAKVFVVCVKIEGCINGVVNDSRSTMGLCVVGSGMI